MKSVVFLSGSLQLFSGSQAVAALAQSVTSKGGSFMAV